MLSENYDDCADTDINAWFGPSNTVSPLHYDPKHNFLAQVINLQLARYISIQMRIIILISIACVSRPNKNHSRVVHPYRIKILIGASTKKERNEI